MSYLPPKGYLRVLVITAYSLISAVLGYLFLKYLLPPLLPFLLAWIVAMMLRPAIESIARRTHLPRKAVAVITVSFVFFLLFGCLIVLCGRMVGEIRELSEDLLSEAGTFIEELFSSAGGLSERLPFLDGIDNPETLQQIENTLLTMVEGALSSFSARIPNFLLNLIASLPGILLFVMALVVATYYLGIDVGKVNTFLAGQLPERSRRHLFAAKKKLLSAGIKYVKAYLMILLITFVQLLIGFFCLKIPYALTLAALIALIDILPVLGVGTVLLPWAAILFLRGDHYTGIGLLIVFGVIWVVRQIIEPKIVGESIGLPPLLTLIAMYVGYHFLGFGGLFILPLLLILLKNLYDIGLFRQEPISKETPPTAKFSDRS